MAIVQKRKTTAQTAEELISPDDQATAKTIISKLKKGGNYTFLRASLELNSWIDSTKEVYTCMTDSDTLIDTDGLLEVLGYEKGAGNKTSKRIRITDYKYVIKTYPDKTTQDILCKTYNAKIYTQYLLGDVRG